MSAQPAPQFAWDVDRYHRAIEAGIFTKEDRLELIEGELLPVPPIGPAHQDIVDELSERLTVALAGNYRVRTQGPVTLRPRSEPEPDILIALAGRYRDAHPSPSETLVAIEVSDTTRGRDEREKLPLYARHGIPELWLVDVNGRVINVYTVPDGERYTTADAVSFDNGRVRSPTLERTFEFDLGGA